LKGLKWLGSQSYGSMYVNFGEFISVRESLGATFPPIMDDSIFSNQVQDIALKVIFDHQKHIVMPLFAAASTVIISKVMDLNDITSARFNSFFF
jgi:glycerol-3-phosphate O-acyltransferase